MKKNNGKNQSVTIPARPYLQLPEDDFDEIIHETAGRVQFFASYITLSCRKKSNHVFFYIPLAKFFLLYCFIR